MDAVESLKSHINSIPRFEVFVKIKFIFYFFENSHLFLFHSFLLPIKTMYYPAYPNEFIPQLFQMIDVLSITHSLRLNAIQYRRRTCSIVATVTPTRWRRFSKRWEKRNSSSTVSCHASKLCRRKRNVHESSN